MDVDSRQTRCSSDSHRLRPVVAESWQRCDRHRSGASIDWPVPVRMAGERLQEYRDRHPLARALPLCREVLGDVARDTGCVFALTDQNGMLLWVEGDRAVRGHLAGIRFHEGALWSEDQAGTNAPGTALVAGSAVQIVTREHYNEAVRGWSCSAAPILDPDSGRPLGALDLTGRHGVATPQALVAVRATALAVEADLKRVLALADARARRACGLDGGVVGADIALLSRSGRVVQSAGRFPPGSCARLVSGDERVTLPDGRQFQIESLAGGYFVARRTGPLTGRLRRAGPHAVLTALGRDRAVFEVDHRRLTLTPRHSEVAVLLALAGEGLSAARLAVDLSVEDCSDVAVRVTMTRLRKVLGDDVLASHPYRLLPPVRCDVNDVRALLEEGRVAEAVAGYPGPLLPDSQAPGVSEHRDALEQQLRGAVLASGDARILRRWVHAPWGGGDASAWEQLARLLPAGSPQRGAVLARARGLLSGR